MNRQPEVQQLDAVRRQEDVRRFQVAVNQPLPLQRVDAVQNPECGGDCLRERQRSAGDARGQRFPLEEFHREKQLAVLFPDLEQLTDRRVVHARGGTRFADQSLPCIRVVSDALHHLQRDRPSELFVARGIDHPHAPFAEGSGDGVPTDSFAGGCHCRGILIRAAVLFSDERITGCRRKLQIWPCFGEKSDGARNPERGMTVKNDRT